MKSAQKQTMSPYTIGFTLSAAVTIIFNMVLTLVKETNPEVLAFMKSLMGHHWTTHGVAVVLLFFIIGFIFSTADDTHKVNGTTLAILLTASVLIGGLGILGFFVLHYFSLF